MGALTVESLPAIPRRSRSELALVASSPASGERAIQLHLEAKRASIEHLEALIGAIETARSLAQGVVDGGGLYAGGLSDFAKRLTDELSWRGKTLQALTERQLPPGPR